MAFAEMLEIKVTSMSPDRVEAIMPITPDIYQPHGFVHGGATVTLLETVASYGAEARTDFDHERPFGVCVRVDHRKSGKFGTLRGVAKIDHVEGTKQFWNVVAYDDEGDIVSDGVVVTKIVSLERLAEKQREREATKQNDSFSS